MIFPRITAYTWRGKLERHKAGGCGTANSQQQSVGVTRREGPHPGSPTFLYFTQAWKQLEAVRMTLPEQNTWTDLMAGEKEEQDMLPSPSPGLSLLSQFMSSEPQHERDKGSLFACSPYRWGVELVAQFWPTVLPTNSNFILQKLCFTEATRTKKELLQWVFLFFQTLRIRNKNVKLFSTV